MFNLPLTTNIYKHVYFDPPFLPLVSWFYPIWFAQIFPLFTYIARPNSQEFFSFWGASKVFDFFLLFFSCWWANRNSYYKNKWPCLHEVESKVAYFKNSLFGGHYDEKHWHQKNIHLFIMVFERVVGGEGRGRGTNKKKTCFKKWNVHPFCKGIMCPQTHHFFFCNVLCLKI